MTAATPAGAGGAAGPALPGHPTGSARILYLDTSALAKRYVAERGSRTVRAAMAAALIPATSAVAYAEMQAALARAHRDGRMDAAAYALATTLSSSHWSRYLRLAVDDALALEAGRLVVAHTRFALRGFDAIHLASAHRLASGRPANVAFACWDVRLWRAARHDGFGMVPAREPK